MLNHAARTPFARRAPARATAVLPRLPRLAGGALLLALGLAAGGAHAQAYPSRTITIVIPTAPGGANDAQGRIIAQAITPLLKQSVIVENKPGGNGAIASEYVARALPDGHTILFGYIATHGINPALQRLKYDPVADFEPIGHISNSPTLLVANNALPVKNARELVALAKARPGTLSYASAGNGTGPHLAAELFKLTTGTDILHVPYKGSSPGIVDTIGGTTQIMFPSLFSVYPQVAGGKLRALGLVGDKRSSVLPDVQTLAEQGIPGVTMTQWYALFAPARTPKPVIERLNRDLNTVLKDPAIARKIADQGAEVETGTPEQLRALVQTEVARWKKVVSAAKITAD